MRRRSRTVVLAGALCIAALLAGCSGLQGGTAVAAPMPTGITAAAPSSAASSGSWYGSVPGIALFVQWARVGANVTGTITGTVNDSGSARTSSRAFTGVVGGSTVVLNFTDSAAGSDVSSVTGALSGNELRLTYPTPEGTLTSVVLKSGTIDDFNRVVATATREAAPTSTADRTFNADKVAAGVSKILTDPTPGGYGQTGVSDVTCPPREPVVVNSTFTCTATINGAPKSILITVKDESGKYEVGVPS